MDTTRPASGTSSTRPSTVRERSLQKGAQILAALAAATSLLITSASIGAAQVPVQIPLPPPAAAPITNVQWLWQGTDYTDGTSVVPDNPSNYTITLATGGRVILQADCNRGTGGYTLNGSQLTFQPVATTLIACPPGSLDTVFLRDLGQVTAYTFDASQMVLNLQTAGGTMHFQPMAPESIPAVTWRIQSLTDGQGGLLSVLPDTQLSATFGADGTVSGNAGCNSFRAAYTLVGSTLTFGPVLSTRRACASAEATAQEQAVLAALSASTAYELVGDRLTLRGADGAPQLLLLRPTN